MHLYRSGVGFLVDGTFPLPDNPILLGTAQIRDGSGQAVAQGVSGMGRLSDLVNGAFPIPQNPISAPTSLDRPKVLTPADTRNALLRSLTAQKTGPVSNSKGMGDAASTLQSVGAVLDNTVSVGGTDIPYWVFFLGAAAVLMYLGGGKAGPSRYQRFKAAH